MSMITSGSLPVVDWMLYTLVISGVIIFAALAAHDAQRAANRPLRWIWIASIAAITALSIAAPFRDRDNAVRGNAGRVPLERRELVLPAGAEDASYDWVIKARDAASAPLRLALERLQTMIGPLPAPFHQTVTIAWLTASAAIGLVFLVAYRRTVRRVRYMPRDEIAGVSVRVAEGIGPAVIGLVPPEIVVPAWLKSRPINEQRMTVVHETEHIRAADPWLLAVACTAVALMPWNPALWYALSRLRLAVEIDCDRRVLRAGVSSANYGALLIELSALRRPLPAAMPAFPGTASHLERRLLAMTERSLSFRSSRRIAGALVAALVLITACESKLPTSAEVEAMDVAAVERQARTLGMLDSVRVRYTVDGVVVAPAEVRELSAARIATVDVVKDRERRMDEVRIRTRAVVPSDSSIGQEAMGRVRLRADQSNPAKAFEGLLIIDEVVVPTSLLAELDRDQIESVEVLKGSAATSKYSDPRAAYGVIRVTTRR